MINLPKLGLLTLVVTSAACRQPDASSANAMAMPAMASDSQGLRVADADRARLGLTFVVAERRVLIREVRLVGRVVPAETALRTITTRVDGYVERLHVDYTGREVRRGEPLLDLYSPMLVSAQEELLLALRLRRSLGAGEGEAVRSADSLVAGARRRFALWDIGADVVAELERTGAVQRTVTLRAEAGGVVLEKNVIQGQAVMAGMPLFQTADLSTVWLEADVFEQDLALVRVGLIAEVTFDAYAGEVRRGRVAWVRPTLDAAARTGRVRVELDNRDGRIRPGLFGAARIAAPVGEAGVVIPRQAALVTGDRQLVFVEDSVGRLVPRLVTLGAQTDVLVEVRNGLRAGERVVATAAFLLDAESNLGAAMAGMAGMDMGGSTPAPVPPRRPPTAPGHNGH